MEIEEDDSGETVTEMEAPGVSTVAIAVSGSRSSRHALKWALDKFVPGGQVLFRILHVRPPITMVPTPMGNYIPISQVRDDVASAYKEELEWQARNMLLPFKKMCAQRKVEAEAVLLESDDVPSAISDEIDKFNIGKLVLGSSSRSIFRRKFKVSKTASKISECIPSFCTAYIISKGKLSFVHSATSETCETPKSISSSTISSPRSRSLSSSTRSEWVQRNGTENVSFHQTSLSSEHDHALPHVNNLSNRGASSSGSAGSEISYQDDTTLITNSHSITPEAQFSSRSSRNSMQNSFGRDSFLDSSDLQAAVSETATSLKHSHDQDDLKLEIENIKVQLEHLQKLHEVAQNESTDSPQNLHNNLGIHPVEDDVKLREIDLTEETVRRLVRQMEREEHEVINGEHQLNQGSSEREASQTNGEQQDAGANKTGQKLVGRCFAEYNRYSWEQIQAATSSFSSDLVIGKGTYGTVYKAKFQHTVAAVKVLNSLEGFGSQQLQQELEVLGKIRHPHLLLLLGACPEHGCVVYEYMENGSLDDVLHHRRNNTPPLAWYDRIRIAWEVATAVAFLHSAKPDPIIHRDLKPANILLDRNLASKVGDVGLSTELLAGATAGGGQHPYSSNTMVKNTAPVGTFCYIDPEYQRTGAVSAKSDVYALGVVVLQLLTGRTSPLGLAHAVETALEDDGGGGGSSFAEMLDEAAGEWPLEETQELAALALRCAEMRRRDRPGLREHVLPALERIKNIAAKAALLVRSASALVAAPGHFLCPILQEVMVDPVVASDGYTYDRKAIEMWLSMKGKSPMTNLRLQSKSLIPNHSLRSAIMDWRSRSR